MYKVYITKSNSRIMKYIQSKLKVKVNVSNIMAVCSRMILGDLNYDALREYVMEQYHNGTLDRKHLVGNFGFEYALEKEVRIHGLKGLKELWHLNHNQFQSLIFFYINNLEGQKPFRDSHFYKDMAINMLEDIKTRRN